MFNKTLILMLCCVVLFPAMAFADDPSGLIFAFTTVFPGWFLLIAASLIVPLTFYFSDKRRDGLLLNISKLLVYISYSVAGLSIVATIIAATVFVNPFSSDLIALWTISFVVIIFTCVIMIFVSHQAIKNPVPDNFCRLKKYLIRFACLWGLLLASALVYHWAYAFYFNASQADKTPISNELFKKMNGLSVSTGAASQPQ